MATVIKLKKSTGSTAPTALGNGEVAYTQAAGTQANGGYRLYMGAGTETGGEADHIDVVGGKYFTDMLDQVHGTLTASSAVIVDSNSKIDNWSVDNININGNTISSTDTNGDIVLDPNGSGVIDANTSIIRNVTDPTQAQDAATKAYVDATSSGLDVKSACLYGTAAALPAVTYANGSSGVGATLTANANGALSVDGGTPSVSDRILVKDQAAPAQNGIYTVTAVGSGSAVFVLTRATDYDTSAKITDGSFTFVQQGTANADNGYVMTTNGTITVGTTAVAFDQFSGAGQITAGAGLTKTGNTMDVGAGTGITVNANDIQVATTYAGGTSIVSLGTVTTGEWTATAIDLSNYATGNLAVARLAGGTGASSTTFWRGDGSWASPTAAGFVTGPGSSTDDALARYNGASGTVLQNSGATLSDAGTLTATAFSGPLTGNVTGNIDGIVGGTTPAAGTFTTLTANDQLVVNAGASIIGDTTDEITLNVKGVGSQTSELLVVEQSDGTNKLEVSAAGVTTAASLVATTADINGGTFDGVVGDTTPAAGTFTTLTANTSLVGTLGTASQTNITGLGTISTGTWAATDVAVAHGGTGLSAIAKGSLLVANTADTLTALDGGGSDDGVAFYTASTDTISWATSLDGGTF